MNSNIIHRGKTKNAILHSVYEYFLVILPILFYISIEASHKGLGYLLKSPEWSIGTIFLSFQAISLLNTDIKMSGRNASEVTFNIMRLFTVGIIIIAAINTYSSVDEIYNTTSQIIVRWIFFMIASISFILLVAAGKSLKS